MSLFIALFIGVIVGSGGSYFFSRHNDLALINTFLGIVCSGFWFAAYFFLFDGDLVDASLFSLPASLCSIIGACILVLGFSALHSALDRPEERAAKSPEKDEKEKIT